MGHARTMFAMIVRGKGRMMTDIPDYPRIEVTQADALWDWLDAEYAASDGAVLITWKAAHRQKYVSREAVLDALVAYGRIDGRRFKVDADRTAQLITPRRVRHWSDTYKSRARRLQAEGRMKEAGLAAIEAAKAAGLWDVMQDVDRLAVPDDLDLALGSLRASWDSYAPSYRRNVLRWIKLAKRADTRARRISDTVAATGAGRKLPQM